VPTLWTTRRIIRGFIGPYVPDPKNDQESEDLFEWCSLLADAGDLIAKVSEADADTKPPHWIR
jgi:hypothetical protein